MLLLLGGAKKRLWAGRYNGLGGHVEPGEDIYTSARREVREEAGLEVHDLRLRCVVHADAGDPVAGILFFVFTAVADDKHVLAFRGGHAGMVAGRTHCRLTVWWKTCPYFCRRCWPWGQPTRHCSLRTATMKETRLVIQFAEQV